MVSLTRAIHTIGRYEPVEYVTYESPIANEVVGAIRHATTGYVGQINNERNRGLMATDVQTALAGLDWNEHTVTQHTDGTTTITIDGNQLLDNDINRDRVEWRSGYSHVSLDAHVESTLNSKEIENLKDEIQGLKDEINELKMLFMEN